MMIDSKSQLDNPQPPLDLIRVLGADWQFLLIGALVSFFLSSILISGWPEGLIPNLHYPFIYAGDGLSHSWIIQRAIEGWIFENPRSGFPFGSSFLDYPGSDSGSLFLLKLSGIIFGNYYAAFNLYFLLGFPSAFLAAFSVMRTMRISIAPSFVGALLFTFLPFHFARLYMGHIFYTWYFVIPIYFYYGLKTFTSSVRPIKAASAKEKAITAIALVFLSCFGVYYALFGILVILASGIAGMNGLWNFRPLLIALGLSGAITLGVSLNVIPNVMNIYQNGVNSEVAQRNPVESEIYGLKIMHLLLPQPEHRIAQFRNFARWYNRTFPLSNTTSSLGVIGILGLVVLASAFFRLAAGRRVEYLIAYFSLIVLCLLTVATVGGLNVLFATLISPLIRGWDRISIFIGFAAIAALFIQLDHVLKFHSQEGSLKSLKFALIGVLCIFGIFDQTASPPVNFNKLTEAEFLMDRKFVRSIETLLPPKSYVYQLPYITFPEAAPLNRLPGYNLLSGFLHSHNLRWSFGGMQGRDGDLFYRALSQQTISRQIAVVQRLGFSGIYIDKRGYEDEGKMVIDSLSKSLGRPPALTREDGEIVFFPLDNASTNKIDLLSHDEIMRQADFYADKLGTRYPGTLSEGIDFRRKNFPTFVKNILGLSGAEEEGRWSDANLHPSVRVDFFDPLPRRFTLMINTLAFGPNAGQFMKIKIGAQNHFIKIPIGPLESRLNIDLGTEKASTIEFYPPKPTSPYQLGMSPDRRLLGVGFKQLSISPS